MKKTFRNMDSFFAAANGYDGFRSNFSTVFKSDGFERLYILKGGPGTGKSTLMKKIGEEFESEHTHVTYIYCSSDPSSLDGVILDNCDRKIAITDGTSPHTLDPIYPGAIDTIVNLGDGFDTKALMGEKEVIKKLSDSKSKSYKSAYCALKLAGEIQKCINNIYEKNGVYNKAELLANDIMSSSTEYRKTPLKSSSYYVGAFCKDGYLRLDIPCIKKDYISLKGDGFSEYAVMRYIRNHLIEFELAESVFPCAFSPEYTDAVIASDTIISIDDKGELCFETDSITDGLPIEYTVLRGFYKDAIDMAKNKFSQAAEYHFKLEEIYSRNIDFSNNENITLGMIKEIREILC